MKKKVFYTEMSYVLGLVIMAFAAAFTEKADFGMYDDVVTFFPDGKYKYETGADGKMYINPFVTRFHSKASFQSITREYPIDFPYPYTVTYMYNLVIPDGYTVEQLPENSLIKFAGLDATVRFMTSVQGSEIAVMFNYTQKKMVGQSGDYAQIREFWQYMNALYESMIVLKKN